MISGKISHSALERSGPDCGRAGQRHWSPDSVSPPHHTDADLVTAIDVSGSIDGYAEWLELAGVADAIQHPGVLQAIHDGFYGRIGFAAFAWSSHDDFVELVPWTEIGSDADARRVAEQLRAARSVPRIGYSQSSEPPRRPWRRNLATDVSAALEHALQLLETTPFDAKRHLINLCANGEDNVGAGPDQVRDQAAVAGITINGVVLGGAMASPPGSASTCRPAPARLSSR